MPTIAKFATLKLNLTNYKLVPIGAFDCSLRLCIKTWAGATFEDSTYKEASPTEIDFTNVTHAPSGQKPFSILKIDPALNRTRFGTYMINSYDWYMMSQFMAAQFSYNGKLLPDDTDDQGVPIMLYQTRDMPSMISKLADSLTNMIRLSDDRYFVEGQAFQSEVFINIQWAWLSLPVLVVLSANVLLAIMILQTWRSQTPVWKSSLLAFLLHGMKHDSLDTGGAATGLLSDMELLAEQKKVRLNGRAAQDLKFVAA